MREYPYPYPWRGLPGRKDELLFLEKRFAEMSVLEQCQMEGVGQIEQIETAADLINLTAQLHNYPFNAGATDAEALGRYIAEFRTKSNPKQYPYLNFKQIGADYHEKLCGVFTQNGYVEITGECREIYNGDNLAQMDSAAIRIKLASKDCPENVPTVF